MLFGGKRNPILERWFDLTQKLTGWNWDLKANFPPSEGQMDLEEKDLETPPSFQKKKRNLLTFGETLPFGRKDLEKSSLKSPKR